MDTQKTNNCPFCGGTELIKGYQRGYGAIFGESSLRYYSSTLCHIVCRNCGSVVHSYVDDPEKLLKRKDRKKQ